MDTNLLLNTILLVLEINSSPLSIEDLRREVELLEPSLRPIALQYFKGTLKKLENVRGNQYVFNENGEYTINENFRGSRFS